MQVRRNFSTNPCHFKLLLSLYPALWWTNASTNAMSSTIIIISYSCLISVSVNFSTFLVIAKTLPVTYQVLGHILHDPFTSRNKVGILVAVLVMGLYSYFCTREMDSGRIMSLENWDELVWNDTTNPATSPEEFEIYEENLFPSWLNSKDLNITCLEDSSPDPALPCMEVGEIEGMDGDRLA